MAEITLDTILDKKYTSHKKDLDDLEKDTKALFTNLKDNKQKLTKKEIDDYIKKFSKLKPRSMCYKIYDWLTEDHILETYQVDKLLLQPRVYYENEQWKWIENLKKHNYEFTGEQSLVLINRYYALNASDIINKKDVTIADLYAICSLRNLTRKNLEDFCAKHKIVPDNKCLEYLLTNTYTHLCKYLDKLLNTLIKFGYKPNNETITEIVNNRLYGLESCQDHCGTIIKILVDNGAVITSNNLKQLLVLIGKQWNYNRWKYFRCYVDIAINNKINITNDLLYLLIDVSSSRTDISDDKKHVYEVFFKNTKITPELCDYVCKKSNESVFHYLVTNNRFIATANSFPSCENYSEYIFEYLVNMKLLPDIECFKRCISHLYHRDTETAESMIKFFAGTGIEITYEIVDMLYQRDHIVDLELYNLKYDDNVYYILHKKGCVMKKKSVYYKKQNQKLMQFREYFKSNCNIEEIKKRMAKYGTIPDMYCYDNACAFGYCFNTDVVEWLEKTYGFKPTSITISRINNNDRRYYLLNKYFLDDAKHHKSTNIKDLYVLPNTYGKNNIIINKSIDNEEEHEFDTKKSIKKKIIVKKID